jgi:hypothetical protein
VRRKGNGVTSEKGRRPETTFDRLLPYEMADLRKVADDAKIQGRFEDGRLLHNLLDRYELTEKALDEIESDDLDDLPDLGEKAREAAERSDNFGDTLDVSAHSLEEEAENLDDVRDSIIAERDRLKAVAAVLKPFWDRDVKRVAEASPLVDADKAVAGAFDEVRDAITNLEDVMSTIQGQKRRLEDAGKNARSTLKEHGR